eukprot:CAMPEP_0170642862 /NCGR_PEP_ID=MMETSP0224-20130122/41559_1 /TAXON_ID=285029 /ORGANISM="Togula jolla, Strain CCCM 725" /LENGTH=101 /DNA_ID=CAMNT_0010973613 /DNA_START=153 /DNA_END=459 /DNA_ORIENTATION=+
MHGSKVPSAPLYGEACDLLAEADPIASPFLQAQRGEACGHGDVLSCVVDVPLRSEKLIILVRVVQEARCLTAAATEEGEDLILAAAPSRVRRSAARNVIAD